MDNKYKYKSYNYDQRKNIDEERLRDVIFFILIILFINSLKE